MTTLKKLRYVPSKSTRKHKPMMRIIRRHGQRTRKYKHKGGGRRMRQVKHGISRRAHSVSASVKHKAAAAKNAAPFEHQFQLHELHTLPRREPVR